LRTLNCQLGHDVGQDGFVRVFKIVAALAIVSFGILIAAFYFGQRSLLYFPTRFYVSPAEAHANEAFREIHISTADGLKLKAWYASAESKPFTIVFFHGNGDSLSGAAQIAEPYIEAGYGFLAVEYRGYSGLPGRPTEAGIYNDGRACVHELIARGVDPKHIILYGHSLGTGVAIQMAREFPVGGLMLLAPYLSIPSLAQIQYPFLPARMLVIDRFENEDKIGDIHIPVLMASGAEDQLIPPSQGLTLFSLANGPKEYHSIPGAGHNDSFEAFAPVGLNWIAHL
jgi:uncharacterized protein